MSWFEALILGIVQGLTEYLPVSSSGHLAIGSALFGIEGEENLAFTIVVHVATVFSTLVVLWKEIDWIFRGLFKFQMNAETKYVINILISMIPIGIVGVFFKDTVEQIFGSGLLVVGCMLLLTAALLAFSYYAKPRQKESISMKDAFIIGLAQACAVMPGLSRSGSTIATGLLLGNNKAKLAQFSFLMVIPPILGEALLDVMKMVKGEDVAGSIPALSLAVGFALEPVTGQVSLRLVVLSKATGVSFLPVPPDHQRGADTLDDPGVFPVLADGVEVHRLAAFLVNHFHFRYPFHTRRDARSILL